MAGIVYLVGAGPGDPDLITLRGRERLGEAEVVIADRLVAPELLRLATGAEVIVRGADRTALAQDEIHRLLVEKARAGLRVVRLKGGDPFVFGRGGEEAEALAAAGVAFEVVPGVTAAIAAPACAGIPLTHRGLAGVVAFATGHEADDKDGGRVDWTALASPTTTAVIYMSVSRLDAVCRRLIEAGRAPSTPAAVIERGTTPRQRTVVGTLADLADKARAAKIAPPALTVVGDVVALRERIEWFESRPLHGRRILALHGWGDEHGDRDAALFDEGADPARSLGVELVIASPFRFLSDPGPLAAAVARRADYRWIAFTSGHAVSMFRQALEGAGLDARALAGLEVASLAGTARQLRGFLAPDLTVAGGGADLARALLAAQASGPVLFPRAEHGRDELPEALRAAGVEVDVVTAYSIVPDPAALAGVLAEHARAPFDALAFTSPRGAELFLDGKPDLEGILIGAIGRTTAAAIEARGVRVDVIPETPSRALLHRALADALARRPKLR